MSALLQAEQLTMRFGGLTAVKEFSCAIESGELFGLIGPNGAGKTTVFNLLTGVYRPSSGTVTFAQSDITGQPPPVIAARGMSRTFQNIRLFDELSALENVMAGAHLRGHINLFDALLRTGRNAREEKRQRDWAYKLLAFMGLEERAGLAAKHLPYGDRRKLEIARALATEPKLICLDEPAAGMNPSEKQGLAQLIRRIRDQLHVTVLLIEHDMQLVMGLCERIQVLDHGETIACGKPREIQSDARVIEAYLGVADA
ncbi:MAG: Lipopolysaccharide export system ATP-binding protein LptB [Planctomycetes bacterium]|nr:Lipopolysaccharide export system ATP-binding protein LptB [Planctomycetota bacterium]